jgi:parvulin-like peptidyl-prolyl isomerase
MGRSKRTSKVLDKANVRASGLRSIGKQDFGNALTSDAYEQAVEDTRSKLDDYNQALSAVDEKANALTASEKTLQDLSERMLAGVAAKYGKNSNEYEKVGGVRKSERKRPPSRKATKTTPPA